MKKLIALATLVTGLGFNSFAQEIPKKDKGLSKAGEKRERVYKTPEELAKIRTERLDKELKFTDAQREKVYKLTLEQAHNQRVYQSKIEDIKKSRHEDKKSHQEKFQQVLTPEQQKMVMDKFAERVNKDSVGRKGDRSHKQSRPETKKMKVYPREKS